MSMTPPFSTPVERSQDVAEAIRSKRVIHPVGSRVTIPVYVGSRRWGFTEVEVTGYGVHNKTGEHLTYVRYPENYNHPFLTASLAPAEVL